MPLPRKYPMHAITTTGRIRRRRSVPKAPIAVLVFGNVGNTIAPRNEKRRRSKKTIRIFKRNRASIKLSLRG
jgi:hypothetical protein